MEESTIETVRIALGLGATIFTFYLIYLAGFEGFTLSWNMVIAAIALVVLLAYGPDEFRALIHSGKDKK